MRDSENIGASQEANQDYGSPSRASSTTANDVCSEVERDREHEEEHGQEEQGDHHRGIALQRTRSIAETMSPTREFLFVTLLCSAQFTTQMALNNTLATLHVIGDGLGITNPGVLPWLIAGYSLTVGSFILPSGRFGDLFGYKIMVVVGYAWFGLWNLIGGFAVYAGDGGDVLFIFSRVMSGIAPAILLPNALGLLGATYKPGRRKNMVFSLFGGCAPGKSFTPDRDRMSWTSSVLIQLQLVQLLAVFLRDFGPCSGGRGLFGLSALPCSPCVDCPSSSCHLCRSTRAYRG